MYKKEDLKSFLNAKADEYNNPSFIGSDPVSIPHRFIRKQDIEISGLFAAILAWGQRKTIINKCIELLAMMDNAPYDFILNHTDADLKVFETFKHRTFNATDTLYFLAFLKDHYLKYDSLEEAFNSGLQKEWNAEQGLAGFHHRFFSLSFAPHRTRKHIATPERKAACKRLNMYLRWMVRKDDCGVDFGLWRSIDPAELICPCDLHVDRVARKLGLIQRKQTDWLTAVQLTNHLKIFDPADPVKYDFALFGLGIMEKY